MEPDRYSVPARKTERDERIETGELDNMWGWGGEGWWRRCRGMPHIEIPEYKGKPQSERK